MKIQPTFTVRTLLSNAGPWIVYGLMAAVGHKKLSFVGGLLVSTCQVALQSRARQHLKVLDVAGIIFFSGGILFTSVFPLPLFAQNSSAWLWWVFVVIAFGSLLVGSPFTAQYARDSVPMKYWENPSFQRVNVTISVVWGLIFLLNAAIATLVALKSDWLSRYLVNCLEVAGYSCIVFGVIFTNRYPQWIADRHQSRSLHT